MELLLGAFGLLAQFTLLGFQRRDLTAKLGHGSGQFIIRHLRRRPSLRSLRPLHIRESKLVTAPHEQAILIVKQRTLSSIQHLRSILLVKRAGVGVPRVAARGFDLCNSPVDANLYLVDQGILAALQHSFHFFGL